MANIVEIFTSVQGEGKFAGCRQIFVRLAGCNLNCAYCDTNFSAKFSMTAEQVAEQIKNNYKENPVHSVSFTGGEPLLQEDFIYETAELIKNLPAKIFLETNGILYKKLKKILTAIDIISMDIKLPSVTGENYFDLHKKFIETARTKDLYIKIVVSNETTSEEFLSALEIIPEKILLILQPVTPVGKIKKATAEKLFNLQSLALKKISDVRIIPQTHKIIGFI